MMKKRFVSNVAILLVLTVAITAILAMLTDAPQRGDDDLADAAEASAAADDPASEERSTAAAEPSTDKPRHLETPAAATETATQVAGVTIAQTTDALAETGPIELLQWMVVGAGVLAAGGMVRGAARDWAKGELTLV